MSIPFHIQQKFIAFNKSVENFCELAGFRYNGKADYFRMTLKFKKDNSAYDNFKVIADLQLLCYTWNFISFVKISKDEYKIKIVNNPLNN